MTSPNPPSWAPTVWLEAGQLHISLPSISNGLVSHRLTLKDNPASWDRLKFLLANRSAQSLLGTKGDLTQHQVDRLDLKKVLQDHGLEVVGKINRRPGGVTMVKPTSAMRSAARDVMRRLGL